MPKGIGTGAADGEGRLSGGEPAAGEGWHAERETAHHEGKVAGRKAAGRDGCRKALDCLMRGDYSYR
ncbi:hypothetical protein HMPREF1981_03616 [Bacteroides pyogenes F0041]|uniref:Uncharacterized protein n=1 Tax=Bacteroides pyogenes F0041 TaxID=1321819 RepID=U2DH46_9BACE|nr:hypothetical protein HMPREF1981_03616 [Bacteroides pyogenes F0041]